MKYRMLPPLMSFFLLLSGCGNSAISNADLKNLDVGSYFPEDSSTATYDTYNAPSNNVVVEETNITHQVSQNKFVILTTATGQAAIVRDSQVAYAVNRNEIIQIGVSNSLTGTSNNQKIILANTSQWTAEPSETDTITGLNKTITVKAGTFNNCIEVTSEVKFGNDKVFNKSYYAPHVGLILKEIKDKNNPQYVKFVELVKFSSVESRDSSTNEDSSATPTNPKKPLTDLQIAAASGNVELVKALLSQGADPNVTDSTGATPLIDCAHSAANPHANTQAYNEIARILLEHGANPNVQDASGDTALSFAAFANDLEMVTLLLNAGANPYLKNTSGLSAMSGIDPNSAIGKLLVQFSTSTNSNN